MDFGIALSLFQLIFHPGIAVKECAVVGEAIPFRIDALRNQTEKLAQDGSLPLLRQKAIYAFLLPDYLDHILPMHAGRHNPKEFFTSVLNNPKRMDTNCVVFPSDIRKGEFFSGSDKILFSSGGKGARPGLKEQQQQDPQK